MVLKNKHNWFIYPDTDESDKDKKMVFEKEENWYEISAHMENGTPITFWLWGESESDIKNKVLTKGYKDIKWIRQGTPSFL